MNYAKLILNKIKNKKIKVGIVGLGYAGLPLLIELFKKKIYTIGFDIDQNKIKKITEGKNYIKNLDFKFIKKNLKRNLVTSNFKFISDVDIIVLCLPTPLKAKQVPDMKYINDTIKTIKKFLRQGQAISLESTTYPGTTKELIFDKIKKNFEIGKNFFIIYSPERVDPGNKDFKLNQIPKVVSGISLNCQTVAERFYSLIFSKIVQAKNTEVAEFSKLLENIFRSVNIGLVNEMKLLTQKMNLNIHEIIKVASSKPFGFMPFYPGPGLGGHCIPIDPFYLTWKAKKFGFETKFIKTAGIINNDVTVNIIKKINKLSKNKKVLIIGLSYKKDIDDMRESPSLKIMNDLRKLKFKVDYHDKYFPILKKNRSFFEKKKSVNLTKENLKKYDLVVISTNHTYLNVSKIYKYSKIILDTRNVYKFSSKKVIPC
jgi:UDP-N-acetyl-D-glucosamine dehydrogenase